MQKYILRRIVQSLPIVALVAVISFGLMHIAPGDAAMQLMQNPDMSQKDVEQLRKHLGLDGPVHEQFVRWVGRFVRGDLGTGLLNRRSVTSLMAPRLEPTLSIAAFGFVLSVGLGIPLGLLAAWKAHTIVDRVVMLFTVAGFSIPVFLLAFVFVWLFALKWPVFPAIGYTPISEGIVPWLRSLALPSITICIQVAAIFTRMTRSTMLEVLQEDYIRTARAKGVSEYHVYVRHAFKNACIPVVTLLGFLFIGLVTGTILVELVFAIPGLGRLLVDAVNGRDYPIVQALLMITALIYIYINLAVDVVYAYVDPRIRY